MLNKHINDFLDYYAQLSSPQYAVMLKDTKAKIKELNRQAIATENITEQTDIQL